MTELALSPSRSWPDVNPWLAVPETKAAAERARLLIEQAEALGEPPEDPLLLFSALWASFNAIITTFNGDVARDRAAQILALAEKQGGRVPLLRGHGAMGTSSLLTGNMVEALLRYDQVFSLYDPVEDRWLAMRVVQDPRVAALTFRSLGLWALGYPEAGLAGTEQRLEPEQDVVAGVRIKGRIEINQVEAVVAHTNRLLRKAATGFDQTISRAIISG
jgi:hypothetical protein